MTRICWPLSRTLACVRAWALGMFLLLGAQAQVAAQAPLNHAQALSALGHADPARRLEGMLRLDALGTASDADAVLPRLADAEPALRRVALALVWRLWGRSGDAAIDALYEQGTELMQAGELPKAVLVFSDIIAKRPAFAEAWNKRATLYFLLDQYELSMKDCDEVLKRVPAHFGALSGYAQMLAELGQVERALEYLERAYQVNPNMANAELMIEDLRRQVEARRRRST